MDYVVLAAPEGVKAGWIVGDDTLIIVVSDDLDPVTRQRYIAQAKAEHGIESTRRRPTIPLLLPAGGFHGASPARKATLAGVSVVAAAGIAAVVILPAALDSNTNSVERNPSAASPAPPQPSQPPRGHRPTPAPSNPPRRPGTPAGRPPTVPAVQHLRLHLPTRGVPASVTAPRHVPGVPALPPKVPVPEAPTPPPITAPRPLRLLAVSVPAAGTRISVSPRLSVRAHLGSLRLRLGQARPGPGHRP